MSGIPELLSKELVTHNSYDPCLKESTILMDKHMVVTFVFQEILKLLSGK